MNISELSLKRPILATVMNLFIILFGVIGYYYLGVREYPAIDPPMVTVKTSYIGANSDIIESQITEPLEKAINGIPGIRTISSSSSVGSSNITVEFDLKSDLETAANEVSFHGSPQVINKFSIRLGKERKRTLLKLDVYVLFSAQNIRGIP